MNIIVNGFANEFLRPLAIDFIKSKNVNNCYFIDIQIDAVNTDVITFLDFRDVTFGKYPVDWQDVLPLDKSLIDAMVPCESVVLKMLERVEQHAGKLTYNERREIYFRHLRYWNHIIEKENIKLFLSSNLPHENYDYVIFSLCKLKGIPSRFFHQTLSDFMMLVDEWDPYLPELKENFQKLEKQDSGLEEIELEKRSENVLSKQLNTETRATPYALTANYSTEKRKRLKKERRQRAFQKLGSSDFYKRIWNRKNIKISLYRFIGRRIRKIESWLLRRYYSRLSVKPDLSKKFIYFPLHRQPELTTSALAGCFVDQKLIVDILAASVPDDFTIYIKENPLQNSFNRSKSFYMEISKIRNVEFVGFKSDTYKLIQNCTAVATASGTAGWEALFRGKQVLLFGNIYYKYANGVFNCSGKEDCEKAIKEILNKENLPDLRSQKLYLKAMESVTSPGYYSHVYQHGSELSKEENHRTLINYLLSKTSG